MKLGGEEQKPSSDFFTSVSGFNRLEPDENPEHKLQVLPISFRTSGRLTSVLVGYAEADMRKLFAGHGFYMTLSQPELQTRSGAYGGET